jgi:hypothetical protein
VVRTISNEMTHGRHSRGPDTAFCQKNVIDCERTHNIFWYSVLNWGCLTPEFPRDGPLFVLLNATATCHSDVRFEAGP